MMEQIFDYRLSIFFSNSLKTNIFYNFFSFLYFQVLIITDVKLLFLFFFIFFFFYLKKKIKKNEKMWQFL